MRRFLYCVFSLGVLSSSLRESEAPTEGTDGEDEAETEGEVSTTDSAAPAVETMAAIRRVRKDENFLACHSLARLKPLPDVCPVESHRVGYTFSDRILVPLNWQLRRFAVEKIAIDIENDKMTPRLDYDGEYNHKGEQLVRVGDAIANRAESVVLTVADFSEKKSADDLLIKYQSNCNYLQHGISAIHPLVLEEFFSH